MTEPLRFAANLKWLFTEYPLEQRPAAAAAAGFSAIEFPWPYGIPADRWRSVLGDGGVRQVLVNTPTGATGSPTEFGSACVPGAQHEFRESVLTALQYASDIGCPRINVMAGVRPREVSPQEATDVYLRNLAWATTQCRDTPITLLVECVNPHDRPGAFVQRQEHAAQLIRDLSSDRLRIALDFYHCQRTQGDLVQAFTEHLPLIAHLQVADVPGRGEPGTGEINYPFLFEVIYRSGYADWIGCEYSPQTDTMTGLIWMP